MASSPASTRTSPRTTSGASGSRRTASGVPAPQPRERGPLHPGIGVQGHHRGGRAGVEEVHPGLQVPRSGYCIVYGKQVHDFADQDGPEVFGDLDFTTGLVHSVNSVFCKIGLRLGRGGSSRGRSGSGSTSALLADAADERRAERPLPGRQALLPEDRLGRGRRAHGVRAGADARHSSSDGHGRGRDRHQRQADGAAGRGSDRRSGREDRAEGTAAADPPGREQIHGRQRREDDETRRPGGNGNRCRHLRVLGRRQDRNGRSCIASANTTWFIAFASPDEKSPAELAIAVVLQNQSGTGRATAAPIARSVMEAILRSTENP